MKTNPVLTNYSRRRNCEKAVFVSFFLCIAAIIIVVLLIKTPWQKSNDKLATYFQYSPAELDSLRSQSSKSVISKNQLEKWDSILFDLVQEHKLGDAYAGKIYAYTYVAQHDVAFLSYQLTGKFSGNIDAVSAKVLCEFFREKCENLKKQVVTDNYSEKLANLVIQKIKTRIESDNSQTKEYADKSSKLNWSGTKPYFAQEVGSWKTWFLKSGAEYRVPPPPAPSSPEWIKQLDFTRSALKNITPEQQKSVVSWAGNPGSITPPGKWLETANDYMFNHDVPLDKILIVRANLAMGIEDSVIAVFDSKYTYWIKRPNMLDPTIMTIMPTPNHPSYPAGHSSISAAAATILIYYFPENTQQWTQYENEASSSRIWGGIHYDIDAKEGLILGTRVGKAVIDRQQR